MALPNSIDKKNSGIIIIIFFFTLYILSLVSQTFWTLQKNFTKTLTRKTLFLNMLNYWSFMMIFIIEKCLSETLWKTVYFRFGLV